ncbi:tetratricopeptide repeat protein [Rivularia sp. PCC 7116]|nr:tetratricopeptide repeat protein [Rivularia sp. PCC 7116]
MIEKFSCHQQPRWFKLSERFLNLWLRMGGNVPKRVGLISVLFLCSFLSVSPKRVNAQALVPHTVQLDGAKLEQQGLVLAQEAAQLAQFRQFDLAMPRARLATQLAPNSDKVWFLLGGLYLQSKELDKAISSLQKAQSLNAKNPETYFALGSAYFQQQKYQSAINQYKLGLKINPKDPEGLFDLGNAYYMLGKLPQAISEYKKSIGYKEDFWPAVNNIGLILYEQGDIKNAINQWQQAITKANKIKQPAAEPQLALAVALYNRGSKADRQRGLAMGEAALRIDERYANLEFLKENLWGTRLLSDTKKFLELPSIQAALNGQPLSQPAGQ